MTVGRHTHWDDLTPSEVATLHALADGDSQLEIAAERGVGRETIKAQTSSLRMKLGAKTTAHAVALAYHGGILTPKRTTSR